MLIINQLHGLGCLDQIANFRVEEDPDTDFFGSPTEEEQSRYSERVGELKAKGYTEERASDIASDEYIENKSAGAIASGLSE